MPAAWRRGQKTWLNQHAAVEVEDPVVLAPGAVADGWKYVLWSKDAVDALVRTEYPHLWGTYKSYPRWVQRADMARYAILHKYGGLYADLDVMARRSWEPVRALCPELLLARADQFGPFLSPDTLMASAGSPFLKHVLERMPAKATSLPRRLLGVGRLLQRRSFSYKQMFKPLRLALAMRHLLPMKLVTQAGRSGG